MIDLGIVRFGEVETTGAFNFATRHWLGVFRTPPPQIYGANFGAAWTMLFSLPWFRKVTHAAIHDFTKVETRWCRPVWMFVVWTQDGKRRWRRHFSWAPL